MTNVTTYRVEGMTCEHCVASVTEEVNEIPGVTNVTVDLASGDVVIDSDMTITREQVASAVDEAGYQLQS